jgi:ATP-dependent DNA helicase RecG
MRPEILFPLFNDVTALPGIGPRLATLIAKLAGPKVKHVLFHKPTGLVDRSLKTSIRDAQDGVITTITARVDAHLPNEIQGKPYKIRLFDETGFLHLVFFHARRDYLKKILPEGEERVISGRIDRFGSEFQIVHPDLVMTLEDASNTPAIEPTYPLTAGVTGKVMRKAADGAVKLTPELSEWIDKSLLDERRWPSFRDAVSGLHHPASVDELAPLSASRSRLAFDELLAHQLALQLVRARRLAQPGRVIISDQSAVDAILAAAPFKPTGAQERAFDDICTDMAKPTRMTRLLHGDVGSGKTFVAALAAANAAAAGVQTALMAPTEILARQHAATLEPLLMAAGLNLNVLTGRDKGKKRTEILNSLKQGDSHVICGTHALFQDDVIFKDLGLVIIDEQHRFGVSDRMRLTAKGKRPDTLVMTATPIPRTLSLAAYGDLDVSRLDEKPPGRIPAETRLASMERLDEVIEGVRRATAKGERVYWVCPLVEESEQLELSSAEDRWRHLNSVMSGHNIGLIHGRMKAAEKEQAAIAFREGKIDVLVATTVIEVGVDAPDATIMIIEHAERFGLAQLHQLRGRVGRGAKPSSCLLLYKGPLGETAKSRLETMRATDDGFAIAEEDWKLRGAGDPLGLRQSGLPDFKLADLEAHGNLIALANDTARLAVARDPELTGDYGAALRTLLYLFEQDRGVRLLKSG